MELSSLRTWQWMIIGTLAGAAVGFSWSNRSIDLGRNGNKEMFRQLVRNSAGAVTRGQPAIIRDIVVYEPETDPSNVLVYPVRFKYQQANRVFWQQMDAAAKSGGKLQKPPEPEWQSSGIYAATPFHEGRSIIDYLKLSKLPYTDRSGSGKYVPMYYGAAGGLAVIGLLWPASIRLMIAAGLAKAPPPRPKKEKKPKHRTGEDVDDMITKAAPKKVNAGALDALNDAMEASLASTLSSGGPRVTTPAAVVEPVSVLMSGGGSRNSTDPTEQPAAPMTPEEKKDYAGDYYPVAKTVKKHDEPH
jgi:hypothetical protein